MRALTAGKRLEGVDRRLDEERHEAEPDAVFLLERLLVEGAQLDHPRHVGFVEGGEDRGGLLDLDQPLGDALAQAAHALAGFAGSGRCGIVRAKQRLGRRAARCGPGAASACAGDSR